MNLHIDYIKNVIFVKKITVFKAVNMI